MQEVRSSNLLSSTGQKHNSNRSNSEYSSKVQQRRPGGSPYVCSDRYLPLARTAGKTADFSHRSAPVRRATWANFRSSGYVTLAAWVVTRLVGAVSRAVTVAVFAGGLRTAARDIPDPLPAPMPVIQECGFAGRARRLGSLRRMALASLRVAPLRRWAAPRRSLAQPRGAVRRLPGTGALRWAGLIRPRLPRRPPPGSPAHGVGARRPGSGAVCARAAFRTVETAGVLLRQRHGHVGYRR